jgi:4-amino-4-deoxy-L-arabinose transferase-like glycosyltransferase
MIQSRDWKFVVGIFLASVLVLVQGLHFHGVEFRDDEVFYFKSTEEMIKTGNILSPTFLGENRFQKPILFYWFILGSFKVFGVSWFAARFASVICAALTIVLTWLLARDLFNRATATLSAAMLLTFSLFFRHAKGAVPDMAMNFFIVLAIYCAYKFIQNPARRFYAMVFFAACGLGFMVKGFAAVIVPFLTLIAYSLFIRRGDILRRINFPLGLVILAVIILPWFLYMINHHGEGYLKYMLIDETKNRMISPAEVNFFIKFLGSVIRNICFYGQMLVIYFAPWSILLIGTIPLTVVKLMEDRENRKSWGFFAVWCLVVLAFFISLFVKINHYLLILSTPLAVLISAFLLDIHSRSRATQLLLKGFMVLVVLSGVVGMIFLQVFLAGAHALWILFYILILLAYLGFFGRTRNPLFGPLAAAFSIVCIFSVQTQFMIKAGLSSHTTWQRMADIIGRDCRGHCVVAVGSHDLHEKELQVYFEQKLEKIGSNHDGLTEYLVEQFVVRPEPQLYSLVLWQDYSRDMDTYEKQKYKDLYNTGGFEIMAEDIISRKRYSFNKQFLYAVLTLNRPLVLDYFKEKVILLRKDSRG